MFKRYQLSAAPIGDFSKLALWSRQASGALILARIQRWWRSGARKQMTPKEDRYDPRSPAELRTAFIGLTHEIEAVEQLGRKNRLFGKRTKIAEQLIAAGGNSEWEFLPLLDDPSPAVRYTAAYHVKPFDRARFEAVLRALAESGDEIGREARSSLEWLKWQEEHPPSPLRSDDPERMRA